MPCPMCGQKTSISDLYFYYPCEEGKPEVLFKPYKVCVNCELVYDLGVENEASKYAKKRFKDYPRECELPF
jgi:rubredoxin